MSTTLSPNMSLPVPGVGSESGPLYATDINNCMAILDQHDHSSGSGVKITPTGLNISSTLTLNNNFLTNTAGITFTAQSSTPAVSTIYESGNDLYYVDGLGNNVQITASGGVAGSPGSIANLTSPASASYVAGSKTFVWQSNTSIAANMDAGSLILRNLTPNSTNGVTLNAPASLSSNYSLTLPALPVGGTKLMSMDTSGNMAAVFGLDSTFFSTNGANIISIQNNSITAAQIANSTITNGQIATNTILASNIQPGTITATQISNSANITGIQLSSTANIAQTQLAAFVHSQSFPLSISTSATTYQIVTNSGINITLTAGKVLMVEFSSSSATGSGVITSNVPFSIGLAVGGGGTPTQAYTGMPAGTYPISMFKFTSSGVGVTSLGLYVKADSAAGTVSINNTLMTAYQL